MKPIQISLADPVRMLQDTYREHALHVLNKYNGNGPIPFTSVVVDYIPIMQALIEEMFSSLDSPANRPGQIPQSTQLLMQAGLNYPTASELAGDIFRATVDIIASYLPDATFNNAKGYQYGFCEPFDLMICAPVPADVLDD